jgi:hypothetical protein
MKKYHKKTLGVFFIILGFLALITPFSPGSWLILVGLELLGLRFLLEDKLPAFFKFVNKGMPKNPPEKNNQKHPSKPSQPK